MRPKFARVAAFAVATIGVLMIQVPTLAQQSSPRAPAAEVALIPGTLTGPGSMGPRGTRRFCNARAVGLAEWRTAALAQLLSLNTAQQAALTELAGVSAKALEMIAHTCETTAAEKSQLGIMEARIETMWQVVKTVRPAYGAFYATLDNAQQLRLDALGPRRNGWRW